MLTTEADSTKTSTLLYSVTLLVHSDWWDPDPLRPTPALPVLTSVSPDTEANRATVAQAMSLWPPFTTAAGQAVERAMKIEGQIDHRGAGPISFVMQSPGVAESKWRAKGGVGFNVFEVT